jgi:hypothetical protein
MILVAVVLLAGVVLAAVGVVHVQNTQDKAGITIDKKELNEKTQEAVEKAKTAGNEVLHKTGQALHKAGDRLQGAPPSADAPAKSETRATQRAGQPEGDKSRPESGEHAERESRL